MQTLFPSVFSSSSLQDVWSCEARFFRKYCQKLQSSGKNADLLAGSHFAKGCEIVRNSFFTENLTQIEAIERGAEWILLAEDTEDSIKSNRRLAETLRKYFYRFPLDGELRPCELSDGTRAVEYAFEFDTGIRHPELDKNICFVGRLDMLAEREVFGETVRYVLDEKTTKSVSRIAGSKQIDYAKEEKAYSTRGQFIGYAWAAKKLGVKIDKALVRRVPILKDHEDAYELEIPISSYMLQHWEHATFSKIAELVEKYKYWKENQATIPFQKAFFPVYNEACMDFHKPCAYKVGCILLEGEEMLLQQYEQLVKYPEAPVDAPIRLDDFLKELNNGK